MFSFLLRTEYQKYLKSTDMADEEITNNFIQMIKNGDPQISEELICLYRNLLSGRRTITRSKSIWEYI